MRILFFCYYNPLGRGGFEKQARGLLKTLIQQGHEIACLTIATPDDAIALQESLEQSSLFALSSWVIPYAEKPYHLKALLLFWLSFNPVRFLANQHPELRLEVETKITELCKTLAIDVIHCLGLRTAYFLPAPLPAPVILDLVDSFTQHKRRTIQHRFKTRSIKPLILSIIDLIKTSRIEQSVLSNYAGFPVAVVAHTDAQTLQRLCPTAQVSVTSCPVDIDLIEKAKTATLAASFEHAPTIAFYGFMEQLWNIDALQFLISEILPRVHQTHPRLNLAVTGLNIPGEIFDLAKQQAWLSVVADVDDIGLFLSSATLTCWPFRYGSGVKTKILESMLFGKPIVTTTLGAEALSQQQQQGLLIGNTAPELAQKIIYLLERPQERLRLGTTNRQIALQEFTWDKKAQDYLNLYAIAKKHFTVIQ